MKVQRYLLRLPRTATSEQLQSLIGLLARTATSKRTHVIVGSTSTSGSGQVQRWVECESRISRSVLSIIDSVVPGARVERVELPSDREASDFSFVGEVRLTTSRRPLATEERVAAGLVSVARSLHKGESWHWQLAFRSDATPRAIHSGSPPDDPLRTIGRVLGFDGDPHIADARNRRDLQTKQELPLIQAVGSLAVTTTIDERARALVGSTLAALRTAEAPGVRVRLKRFNQRGMRRRLIYRQAPLFEWPLQLNLAEAVELLGWPTGTTHANAAETKAQWLPAPDEASEGIAVGRSRDRRGREVTLRIPDRARLMHTQVLGPTGSGKSTVLAQMVLADIAAGRGVVVLDPKRDLVAAVLARVPKDMIDRIVVFDPAVDGRRLGLNPLRSSRPEQATDFIVALMRGLFSRSWGPRTEDVLRTGVLTLALAGNRTLVDLPRLLTDVGFRSQVLSSVQPHPLLAEYWTWYERLSDAHRAEITAPLLSRLRSLLLAGPLHQILGQVDPPFDLDIVFRKRQVVLVPLSAGQLGSDAAGLLGALVMARLWQLIQARTALPEHVRHPVMLYLDEFQQYLHLPTSMADALAQARGLGVGLTLAHQHLDQLGSEVRATVLANARNRIVFQLPARDAAAVAADMAPLTALDLSSLGPFEIYLRRVEQSVVGRPISGYTLPLKPGVRGQTARIARSSIDRYGRASSAYEPQSDAGSSEPARARRFGSVGSAEQDDRSDA